MWLFRTAFTLIFLGALTSCSPHNRVVNGTDSDIRVFPFMVSVRIRRGHFCGGSIIASNWILTAAHCFHKASITADVISVQYGSTVFAADSPNVVKVKRKIIHENYKNGNHPTKDIALLELEEKLIYNYKTIAPVLLPEKDFEIPQVPEGAPGILIGFGRNETGGPSQEHLQEVDLKIYSDAECNSRHNGETTADQICAGVDEGGKGQCGGDSGGPLLYNGNIQLGIVSWSIKPCTVAPYPGVYTKVSHYIDWIHKHIDSNDE